MNVSDLIVRIKSISHTMSATVKSMGLIILKMGVVPLRKTLLLLLKSVVRDLSHTDEKL